MNKVYLIWTLILLPQLCMAQVLGHDASNTFFSEMWNVYNTHRRINYITLPPFMKVNSKSGWPVLFEANVSPYFTFFRGRDYGNYGYSRPQMKSLMVYFNPELTLRMYREEPIGKATKSLPVLPINFAPRLSVVKFLHKTLIPNQVECFVHYDFLELSLAHYSNGQENPHFVRDTVTLAGDSIPNYYSGNFSTNFWRLVYTHGYIDRNLNIYSVAPYIQNDGGWGNLFSYDRAQLRSYGKWRIGAIFQFQSKKTKFGSKRQKVFLDKDPYGKALDKFNPRRILQDYFATWTVRVTSEAIVDNVNAYPSSKTNILSLRAQFLWHPLNWRNFGVMAEYYRGRDFYNIRFYHSIEQIKLAIVADPSFYLPRNTFSKSTIRI